MQVGKTGEWNEKSAEAGLSTEFLGMVLLGRAYRPRGHRPDRGDVMSMSFENGVWRLDFIVDGIRITAKHEDRVALMLFVLRMNLSRMKAAE